MNKRRLSVLLLGPPGFAGMNRTVKGAKNVHGKDPQLLIEKIIRDRIYESRYWKESCFGTDTEKVLELAAALDHVGGTYSNLKPTPFLCLTLRLLQLQPDEEALMEFIIQEDFKYIRALGIFYFRLVGTPSVKVYKTLEPYLADKRKLRLRMPNGTFDLTFMDQVIDDLLRDDRVFGIILPRLTGRMILEENDELDVRESLLEDFEEDLANLNPTKDTEHAVVSTKTDDNGIEELSIDETNALRAKLGLKPLS